MSSLDRIEELKKYNELYKEGVLTDEEFSKVKKVLLGLELEDKKDTNKADNDLSEDKNHSQNKLEEELAKEKEKALQEYKDCYSKEKARLQAKLELDKEKRDYEQSLKKEKSKSIENIFLWILFIGLLIFAYACFVTATNPGYSQNNSALYIVFGICVLIQVFIVCPFSYRFEKYANLSSLYEHRYKYLLISALITLLILILVGSIAS